MNNIYDITSGSAPYLPPLIDVMRWRQADGDCYNIQYHHSIIDSDNVNDSIKVKILYDELMKLKTEFLAEKTTLMGEINYLQDKNKKLEDEVASIKQALYFG
jgi:hypothetical protein